MKINTPVLAMTAGIVWGAAILMVAAANLVWPDYGALFLQVVASVYPGYQPGHGVISVAAGTAFGLVDGAIAGAIFGWLYNLLARP